MDSKEFSYRLAKSLSEDLPFKFNVEKTRYQYNDWDSYPIFISTPEEYRMNVDIPNNTYIEKDTLPEDVYEVYLRIGYKGYQNFGRVKDPSQVSEKIIKYLFSKFEKEIKMMGEADFVFSSELKDFLKKNDYGFSGVGNGSPDLINRNNGSKYWWLHSIVIQFHEYKGSVLVIMMAYYSGSEDEWEERELYRSVLNRKNQKEVFSDILKEIKKSSIDSGADIDQDYAEMDAYYNSLPEGERPWEK